eukprot:CAMPEP_0184753772 /NCGR_PEP_ID=MMETSP0315-20130426/44275_1 /TAXON_ID=101924 /ORGANISM="Rhodosorus marinus, Strain UTEX LB 2760" /LENGTH=211 /DNA_ID=CAMNT_0027233159 /DNA_START=235 /DNA_END=868 /DNA_ORIENTATION=-
MDWDWLGGGNLKEGGGSLNRASERNEDDEERTFNCVEAFSRQDLVRVGLFQRYTFICWLGLRLDGLNLLLGFWKAARLSENGLGLVRRWQIALRRASERNEDDDEVSQWVERVISQNRNLVVPSEEPPKARKRARTPERQIQRSKPWDRNQSYLEKRPESDPPSMQADIVEQFYDLCAHDCPICMSPMTRSKVSVLLPCFHRFCYPCIRAW